MKPCLLALLLTACAPAPDPAAIQRRADITTRLNLERDRELNHQRYTFHTADLTTLEGKNVHLAIKLDTETGRAWRLVNIAVPLSTGTVLDAAAWTDIADNLRTQVEAAEIQEHLRTNLTAEQFLNQPTHITP